MWVIRKSNEVDLFGKLLKDTSQNSQITTGWMKTFLTNKQSFIHPNISHNIIEFLHESNCMLPVSHLIYSGSFNLSTGISLDIKNISRYLFVSKFPLKNKQKNSKSTEKVQTPTKVHVKKCSYDMSEHLADVIYIYIYETELSLKKNSIYLLGNFKGIKYNSS